MNVAELVVRYLRALGCSTCSAIRRSVGRGAGGLPARGPGLRARVPRGHRWPDGRGDWDADRPARGVPVHARPGLDNLSTRWPMPGSTAFHARVFRPDRNQARAPSSRTRSSTRSGCSPRSANGPRPCSAHRRHHTAQGRAHGHGRAPRPVHMTLAADVVTAEAEDDQILLRPWRHGNFRSRLPPMPLPRTRLPEYARPDAR